MRLSRPSAIVTPRLRGVALRALPLALALLSAACDTTERVKNALKADQGDPVWQGDSTLLAPHPEVLFRVTRDSTGPRIVPLATMGPQGFRLLTMSDRGWRSFDIDYLNAGKSLTPYRGGRPLAPVSSTRGMWEGAPLDTIRGCSLILPGALASIPDGVEFFTSGKRPPLKAVTSLSAGELQTAIDAIPTLIAPAAGISMSMLPRYKREVFVAETGNGPRPTIVVVYDDPEVVADSVRQMGARPRHLVVVLDKGVYGYKPTFTYTTLGNKLSPPRYRYLDHIDVDDDGKSELFFGLKIKGAPLYTIVLRYEAEAWRELLRNERQRCHA
ncbi:hypothetical protein [Gemmatimonas groenlandica]|uniref:Lipoprotein n=1 Tax=Gemmatimonas groenlandica TaxID=2732249 RepID=A0A6M4IV10_9BACT|nr:hypothetical protein [Gemmatimonas groenlandica]QJR36011.1 hypothetical protein HKW67_11080 [Gemmatimonas groenlandica]